MHIGKLIKWFLTLAALAVLTGSASALFLYCLDAATHIRFEQSWLIYLLPIFGLATGFYYRRHGRTVKSANHLILSSAHKPEAPRVPFRLAPSIFIATIGTHLFGGSAGREGTAIQMGAGIAAGLSKRFTTTREGSNLLILCGIAAGFGAVFGTPCAGAVFALEFIRHKILSRKILPCLITAIAAHHVCLAWGTHHTPYPSIAFSNSFSTWFSIIWKLFLFAVILALIARLFIWLTHFTTAKFQEWFPHDAIRASAGGVIVIALFLIVGNSDYLGLGVLAENRNSLTIPRFFSSSVHAPSDAWLWKIAFTVITLAAGFKGGEVTPLLFVGASLGNSLAWFLGAPADLFAGIGMVAIFAAATNTPYACIIMGIELLGWKIFAPLALCTMIAWKLSSKKSIYPDIKEL